MTINTAMLVALGFLIAALLAVLIAPAYRRRTVRLTTDALKRSLPLTESEMRADKDRLRADHAIRVHNLEAKLEQVTLSSARQKIEMNRRDARISELEGIETQQRGKLDEFENARRVLEQTLTDRLPKIEARLEEARKLLSQRDSEVATLAETAQKQARAIAEATQMNVQQAADIDRLTTALATRAARNTDQMDARFDSEVAMRSEIDALRAKTRDQSALIVQLQGMLAKPVLVASQGAPAAVAPAVGPATASDGLAARAEQQRLKAELDEMQSAVRAERAAVQGDRADAQSADADLRRLRSANQDMAADLARLKAALASYERAEPDRGAKESPIAMKARIAALEAQASEQATTISSLRAEAAAANERLARQAAHYMDEMKRLGAGTLPASGEARRAKADSVKRPLSDRIKDPRVVRLAAAGEKKAQAEEPSGVVHPAAGAAIGSLFSLRDQQASDGTLQDRAVQTPPANDTTAPPDLAAVANSAAGSVAPVAAPRRPRLLERITQIDKPGSS
jgi:chromosome segregation ATPase